MQWTSSFRCLLPIVGLDPKFAVQKRSQNTPKGCDYTVHPSCSLCSLCSLWDCNWVCPFLGAFGASRMWSLLYNDTINGHKNIRRVYKNDRKHPEGVRLHHIINPSSFICFSLLSHDGSPHWFTLKRKQRKERKLYENMSISLMRDLPISFVSFL